MYHESQQNSHNTDPNKRIGKKYLYQKKWELDKRFSAWVKKSRQGNSFYYCKICNCDRKCTKGTHNLTVHMNSDRHRINSGVGVLVKPVMNEAQGSMNQSTSREVVRTPSTSNTQMTVGSSPPPVATEQINSASKIIKNDLHQEQGSMNQSSSREDVYTPSTSNTQMTVESPPPPVATYEETDTKTKANTAPMDICSPSSNPLQGPISSAKIKMSWYLARRKLQLDKTEDLENLIKSVCPDSEIAKHLTLKETEAHSIVSNITGNIAQKALINTLITEKFSLIIEENLNLPIKQLTIMVRTAVDFKVKDQFLYLMPLEKSISNTLDHIYSSIKTFFESNKIPYKANMIGLAAEASSSIFTTNISTTTLTKDIPNLFLLRCVRNSFLICISTACSKLLPKGIKDFVLKQMVKKKKKVKLSENFEKIVLEYKTVTQLIPEQFNDPIIRLYSEFFIFIFPCFNKANMEMQSEIPKLHKLYKHVIELHKEIFDCFIKKELLAHDNEEEMEKKLFNVKYELKDNHLPTQSIYLGGNVSALLLDDNFISKIPQNEVNNFKETCKNIYIESITQVRQRCCFEIKEITRLKSLTFLDPKHLIIKESEDSIAHLGNYFKGLCPRDMTELDREWRKLRNHKSLSKYDVTIKAQDFWKDVSEMKKDNLPIYPILSQLVRSMFALPYSSAANERIFSSINILAASVQNRKTETLQGLLHIQSLNNKSEPTKEHLKLFNKIFSP